MDAEKSIGQTKHGYTNDVLTKIYQIRGTSKYSAMYGQLVWEINQIIESNAGAGKPTTPTSGNT